MLWMKKRQLEEQERIVEQIKELESSFYSLQKKVDELKNIIKESEIMVFSYEYEFQVVEGGLDCTVIVLNDSKEVLNVPLGVHMDFITMKKEYAKFISLFEEDFRQFKGRACESTLKKVRNRRKKGVK